MNKEDDPDSRANYITWLALVPGILMDALASVCSAIFCSWWKD